MGVVVVTPEKKKRLAKCLSPKRVMIALAIDHGQSLLDAIRRAAKDTAQDEEDLATFKRVLAEGLSPHASAILLDFKYGDHCQAVCAHSTGIIRAYETDTYGPDGADRLTQLPVLESVQRLGQRGAHAIKLHLYFDPDGDSETNNQKRVLIERVGAECAAHDMPFIFEPLVYRLGVDPHGLEFAKLKPALVRRTAREFCDPKYFVDLLKVEIPVSMGFVAGVQAQNGTDVAYDRKEALRHFQAAAEGLTCPISYLSAGVTVATFIESLDLAAEAGVDFCGFVCGRVIWQDAITIFATKGVAGLDAWVVEEGVTILRRLAEAAQRTATPLELIDVEGPSAESHQIGSGVQGLT